MSRAFHHVLSRLNQAANGPQEGRETDTRTIRLDDLRQLLNDWNRLDDLARLRNKDADRYVWLRDHSGAGNQFYLSTPLWFTGVRFRAVDVDSAIDAMASREPS